MAIPNTTAFPSFKTVQTPKAAFSCGQPEPQFQGRLSADTIKFGTNYDEEHSRGGIWNPIAAFILLGATVFGIHSLFKHQEEKEEKRDAEAQWMLQGANWQPGVNPAPVEQKKAPIPAAGKVEEKKN